MSECAPEGVSHSRDIRTRACEDAAMTQGRTLAAIDRPGDWILALMPLGPEFYTASIKGAALNNFQSPGAHGTMLRNIYWPLPDALRHIGAIQRK
jgi:hypothetical protein